MKYVKTNMGAIPLEDYLDMVAMQHGFDDYEDMKENGCGISIPECIEE